MSAGSMAEGWYYSNRTTGTQAGPLSWGQLYAAAQQGAFGPQDLVWNQELPEWVPAGQVPGLLPSQPPTAAAAPATVAPAMAAPAPAAAPRPRRRSNLLAWLIPLIAIVVVGAGLGSYFGFFYDRDNADSTSGSSTASTASSGTSTTGAGTSASAPAECTSPDPAKIVATNGWGEIPINRLIVVLADGRTRDDAEAVAETVGGSIVGRLAAINAYQVETSGSTEAELNAALATVRAATGVELAFPDVQISPHTEIWGVRTDPLNDPAYANGKDGAYKLIGAPQAWTYMRGCGLPISPVHVGVVDNGLYRGNGEYDGDVGVYFPDPNAGELSDPNANDPTASHGTMVTGQVGADPGNGGPTGVAAPVLGNNLEISFVDHTGDGYGDPVVPKPDPEDPTVVTYSNGRSYSFGSLVAITREIEAGARVINCSWGFDERYLWNLYNKEQAGTVPQGSYAAAYQGAKDTAAGYKRFFEKMSVEHPEVLFVCAAGNTSHAGEGPLEFPAGFALPNMVSVGNVNNDGTTAASSSRVNTAEGKEFEITLAAAGRQTVQGLDKNGQPIAGGFGGDYNGYDGGTSAASPQVAAAAALLLALDPELTAAEIKQILSDTARPGPADVGGKILAVDQAVLEVINRERERLGLPRVTGEELEKGGVIDAVAISQDEPNTWMVKAIVESLPSVEGAEIAITATTGTKIEGETSQKLTSPGEVVWIPVVVANETAEITVTRKDSGASSVIKFELIDLNGLWEGSLVFTDIKLSPEAQAELDALAEDPPEELEGCDLSSLEAILQQLKGKPCPMSLGITAEEGGTGTADLAIDFSALGEVSDSAGGPGGPLPMTWSGNRITMSSNQDGQAATITGEASSSGEDLVMNGTMTIVVSDEGKMVYTMVAEWHLVKQ